MNTPTTPLKFVLTGGPCAGKTTILERLKYHLGDEAEFVPEVATWVLALELDREHPAALETAERRARFQHNVLRFQIAAENRAVRQAQEQSKQLVICDRGTLDGAAYTPGGTEVFCDREQLCLGYELNRYEMVIHLESLATADPANYGTFGNCQRSESVEEAAELEYATRAAWGHHPCRFILPGDASIDDKTKWAKSLILA